MNDHSDSRSFERAETFDPVPVRRRVDGWTAERQRAFIALSEAGCVSQAAEVGLTPRSAFRLAARPDAQSFAKAWAWPQTLAANRLTSLRICRARHARDGVEGRHMRLRAPPSGRAGRPVRPGRRRPCPARLTAPVRVGAGLSVTF